MQVSEEDYLAHYGILRKSGRYPWGSGNNPNQRSRTFLDVVEKHRKEDGMSEKQIADAYGMSLKQLRDSKSIAIAETRMEKIRTAERLQAKGMSVSAIGRQMGANESTIRGYLAPGARDKADTLRSTVDMLRRQVEEKGAIDVGSHVEKSIPIDDNTSTLVGISSTKFQTAVERLRQEGYEVHQVNVPQLFGQGFTKTRVLARKDVEWKDLKNDPSKIKTISEKSPDNGHTFAGTKPPKNMSSKRVQVAYKEDGGDKKDGLIEIRPGAKDLDMGGSNYAQVRIAVDRTHYLKGMAVYNKDLPPGVDVRFNTNKSKKDAPNKKDAMKEMEKGPDGKPNLKEPFTAQIKPGGQRGHLNIIKEAGDWDNQNKALATQMLSKQSPKLAKTQLDLTHERRRKELDEINALTNPVVRKKLLEAFADETDSAAVHLQAAALPKQSTKVLIPVPSVKPNEIYAPGLKDGTRVALVRFPHAGTFEIPEVTVNNKNPQARKLMGSDIVDAVGINHKVAERLSGADFDGDDVLVIPNNRGEVKSSPALKGLKDFDPRASYRVDPAVRKTITKDQMGYEMGLVSNLITDMTIRKASSEEMARAVRHSMVVIDSEKHNLDTKASKRDNGIDQLYKKYTGKAQGGGSTLISRAKGTQRVPEREARKAKEGGPIDKATGRKVYVETGRTYKDKAGKTVPSLTKAPRLSLYDDAHDISSGTVIEKIYADHSNRLKAMANDARKTMVNTANPKQNKSSKRVYAKEVASLEAQLRIAQINAPRERQAQAVANAIVSQKRKANPNMDEDQVKKEKRKALADARERAGAKKVPVKISDAEWQAIQAGAISSTKLRDVLNNADIDDVRRLATPKNRLAMSPTKTARAQAMLAAGFTQAEVADQLGVALSTLKLSLG